MMRPRNGAEHTLVRPLLVQKLFVGYFLLVLEITGRTIEAKEQLHEVPHTLHLAVQHCK